MRKSSSNSRRCCSTRPAIAEALEPSARPSDATDRDHRAPARIGIVRSALRIGEFTEAQREARRCARWRRTIPRRCRCTPTRCGRPACSTKPSRYRDALALAPACRAASTAWPAPSPRRTKLDEALNEAQAALKTRPRDTEMHHTVGAIFERMRRYEQAAAAYTNYINLLPNKDRSEKAAWSRVADPLPEVVRRARADRASTTSRRSSSTPWTSSWSTTRSSSRPRVNGGRLQDFVLDTGSEQTTISRQTASSAAVRPITYTLSAGVGEVGLRGLQLGRLDAFEIGTLKLRTCRC